ncbi:hypothetical protein EDD16DRAFT_1527040 [Pisolithus croceorrhizus]|nr:hypothetical protein EDD16DRAFT_1527040 [Pisolithus croceorrhizus]KAI6100974.1 hypothetical protein EV401DRAFT_1894316 [Pisolithus croceorrhizus]KAI6169843.1 hypothetical protein EDD17DRAFT_1502753 [Pisolithus thermaeus]
MRRRAANFPRWGVNGPIAAKDKWYPALGIWGLSGDRSREKRPGILGKSTCDEQSFPRSGGLRSGTSHLEGLSGTAVPDVPPSTLVELISKDRRYRGTLLSLRCRTCVQRLPYTYSPFATGSRITTFFTAVARDSIIEASHHGAMSEYGQDFLMFRQTDGGEIWGDGVHFPIIVTSIYLVEAVQSRVSGRTKPSPWGHVWVIPS